MTSKQPRWSAVRSDLRFEFVGPNCICYNAVWTVLGLFGTNGRKKEERTFGSTRVDGFAATKNSIGRPLTSTYLSLWQRK